jgi:hypothetical protein
MMPRSAALPVGTRDTTFHGTTANHSSRFAHGPLHCSFEGVPVDGEILQ